MRRNSAASYLPPLTFRNRRFRRRSISIRGSARRAPDRWFGRCCRSVPPVTAIRPINLFSAFAGNPLLIGPDLLASDGFLSKADLESAPDFRADSVEFNRVSDWNLPLLHRAYRAFRDKASRAQQTHRSSRFCQTHAAWLDDYALFIALKDALGPEHSWTAWDQDLVQRSPAALAHWRKKLQDEIDCRKYWQFEFFRQYDSLRDYCRRRNMRLMGDIPIYVAHDSSMSGRIQRTFSWMNPATRL